jgi:hypothetical protein
MAGDPTDRPRRQVLLQAAQAALERLIRDEVQRRVDLVPVRLRVGQAPRALDGLFLDRGEARPSAPVRCRAYWAASRS